MDTDLPAYQISRPVIAAVAALSVGVVVFTLGAALRARRMRAVTGKESMIGATARVVDAFADDEGRVRAFGEVWQARARRDAWSGSDALNAGDYVTIVEVDGLFLIVEPRSSPS